MSDFFDSSFGDFPRKSWRSRRFGHVVDAVFDFAMAVTGAKKKVAAAGERCPAFRILIIGVAVPSRAGGMEGVLSRLKQTKHEVSVCIVPMAPAGKYQNLNTALALVKEPLESFDWIVATDDDIGFEDHFLDKFLGLATECNLKIAQPAHQYWSYCSWWITQRHWGSLVRHTPFVEIGPLNAFHRDTFKALMPFEASRNSFGIDAYWAELAKKHGWAIGVVDGTPVEHQRPTMESYKWDVAAVEGREFLKAHDVKANRRELLQIGTTVKGWV